MVDVRSHCESIINIALSLVGSHYLWGATGATPGGNEGINRRRGSVTLVEPPRTAPQNPAIFAAQCSEGGYHVCGGRWDASKGGIIGGRTANPNDMDLKNYLALLSSLPRSSWEPYYGSFSPRMVQSGTTKQMIVWGEDCRGKQHFDCVGFINYCVEISLNRRRDIQYNIDQWNTDSVTATSAVAMTSPPHPADVLITANLGHIGFMVGDGTGDGDWGSIVHAEQTSVGVITRPFIPSDWKHRRRMQPYLLRP